MISVSKFAVSLYKNDNLIKMVETIPQNLAIVEYNVTYEAIINILNLIFDKNKQNLK